MTPATIKASVSVNGAPQHAVAINVYAGNAAAPTPSVSTGTTNLQGGAYPQISGPDGPYVVRQAVPPGFVQVTPANNLGVHVNVTADNEFPAVFVNQPAPVVAKPPVTQGGGPVAVPIAQLAWIGFGGNVGGAPTSDPLGVKALKQFKMSRVRLWQYGTFTQAFPQALLKSIAAYRAEGISTVLTYNFQNNEPRLGHPSAEVETAYLKQLPPASEIGQLICEWGNEIDSDAYYTGGAAAYAAGFSIFADIMHAKGHLACVGNMTSASDAMALGNPASNSLYMQLAKAGTFAKADRAGGHYYTPDHASSLKAHQATATWLKTLNPALVYHSTEINLHNAGAAWASELGLLVAGLKAAGLGGDIFPLNPTGTAASAGSLLDANGNISACGTAYLGVA